VCRKLVIDGALPLLMPVKAHAAPFGGCTTSSNAHSAAGTTRANKCTTSEVVYINGEAHVSVSIKPSDNECSSYCGPGYVAPSTVKARLISHRALLGQEQAEERAGGAAGAGGSIGMSSIPMPSIAWKNKECADTSPFLIIHFHGGGFIAQSSASHEAYLRDWAKELNAPILSVDYDLAPEHPFPVAVCQGFYAYCWAIKHASQLGSSAKSILCVGDSAGGNLAAVVTLRALELGITQPSGVVMIYPALYLHMTPCASRVLSLMDPLLPLGTLQLCMTSYAQRFQV
jgi:hormone-sensitive lipase